MNDLVRRNSCIVCTVQNFNFETCLVPGPENMVLSFDKFGIYNTSFFVVRGLQGRRWQGRAEGAAPAGEEAWAERQAQGRRRGGLGGGQGGRAPHHGEGQIQGAVTCCSFHNWAVLPELQRSFSKQLCYAFGLTRCLVRLRVLIKSGPSNTHTHNDFISCLLLLLQTLL